MDNPENDNTLLIFTNNDLYNNFLESDLSSRNPVLADDHNKLLQLFSETVGSTVLLDLSRYGDDTDNALIKSAFRKGHEQRIVIITEENNRDRLFEYFMLGARGFISPGISTELLVKSVQAIEDGEFWISRKLVAFLMSRLFFDITQKNLEAKRNRAMANSALTPRESDIAECVAKGKCDRIIAQDLKISPNTVKNHMHNIFNKLNINDRFQLALIYHGIQLH